jgi:hypothetical protein
MIQTDKYKKGIIALCLKAAEVNPGLGAYQMHYLNEKARFVAQLTNGQLEIEIDLARQYDLDPERQLSDKLQQLIFSNSGKTESLTRLRPASEVDSAWRKLFTRRKIST